MKTSTKKRILGIIVILIAILLSLWYFLPYFQEAEEVEVEVQRKYKLVEKQITETQTPEEEQPVPVEHGDNVAWLKIESCEIDYPVYDNDNRQAQYKGVTEDFYLHHDEDGNEIVRGCIYTNNYEASPIIIYGHHMSDGSMFGRLSGCVYGTDVELQDLTMSDYKTHYYSVWIAEEMSSSEVFDYIDDFECDLVLVTCTNRVKDGRLVVICKEVYSIEE